MFCRNCGKELSDEAVMCPVCGTPIVQHDKKKKSAAASEIAPVGELKGKTSSIVAFACSLIAFVCCVFFVSYTAVGSETRVYIYKSWSDYPILPLLFGITMGLFMIATSLVGLIGGVYGVIHAAGARKYKAFSVTAIALSAAAIALFFLLYLVYYLIYTY